MSSMVTIRLGVNLMKPDEIIKLREKLGLDRHEFAEFLCLAGYRPLMHIELGTRRPNKLAIRVMRYLESLPKTKALGFIEELQQHETK